MRPTHRILTILIAGMLPFCCCSIRTMAALVMLKVPVTLLFPA